MMYNNNILTNALNIMVVAFTASEFNTLGHETAKCKRWQTHKAETQLENYARACGVCPDTSKDVWEALRAADDEDMQLPDNTKPLHLLLVHRFL